jgi:hypothetical protein
MEAYGSLVATRRLTLMYVQSWKCKRHSKSPATLTSSAMGTHLPLLFVTARNIGILACPNHEDAPFSSAFDFPLHFVFIFELKKRHA